MNVQRDFLKYTAQKIKFDLQEHHAEILKYFYVNAKDRQYQFWQRNPLSVDVYTAAVLEQKIKYIHENPVRAGLALHPAEYHYSSASYYETGIDQFGFLSSP
ncbi:hypothetical protein [Taibaiella chishuiensis]|nr:hypothetical protein [Taibaiella chishuiensis]